MNEISDPVASDWGPLTEEAAEKMGPKHIFVFNLARDQWRRTSLFKRGQLHDKLRVRYASVLDKIPPAVVQTLETYSGGRFSLQLVCYITDDYRTGFGQILGLSDGAQVTIVYSAVFAPVEYVEFLIAHELAHMFLRANNWRSSVPTKAISGYESLSQEKIAEEHEVDRLVRLWGFGFRDMCINAWHDAVVETGSMDCLKAFRRQLKQYAKGQLP